MRPLYAAISRRARWPIACLTTMATAAVLITALAGPAQAAYPGADGLIAFVRSGNIYTINPESTTPGSTVRRLTRGGHDSGPRWSPDGARLAYLDGGNLWVMNANGSHKTRLTNQAPAYTDARPSWSPNGQYLAFVKTKKGARYGYLTRYDIATRKLVTFSVPYNSEAPTVRQIRVRALPGTAVAWGWALDAGGGAYGSFIIVEGEGSTPFCQSGWYCLDAIGFPAQSRYKNGFPSAEWQTPKPVRHLDPDWYPISPQFGTDLMTTQARCPHGHCTYSGINETVAGALILPGAYQAVYSPDGGYVAYVRNSRGTPRIYILGPATAGQPFPNGLTTGTQPDWQPVPVTIR
jgi:Dipeptidyl peptidase IV (DPP IV) N-terminal region/WD40-like Beta Propeller Repeat